MLNLKKTAVAVLALGSSAVFAGTMGPVCTPGNVTVPCERNAWEVGGYALYLQSMQDGGVAYLNSTTQELYSRSTSLNDDWNWGFMIEAGYHFGTGNDFNLNWYHLDASETRTGGVDVSPTLVITPVVDPRNVDHRWNAINAEVGQVVDFSPNDRIRFHGGAQFVDFQVKVNSVVGDTTELALTNFSVHHDAFGPRTGADMSYGFGNGFDIYAKGAAALLVGTGRVNDAIVGIDSRHNEVFPEFEGKLGLDYSYAMAQGDLTLDAGYMWVDYLTHHHKIHEAVGGAAMSHHGDFELSGVYFGLKYVGNV